MLKVVRLDLEVAFRVKAGWATVGGFLSCEGESALTTLPDDRLGTMEGVLALHVGSPREAH